MVLAGRAEELEIQMAVRCSEKLLPHKMSHSGWTLKLPRGCVPDQVGARPFQGRGHGRDKDTEAKNA